MDQFGVKKPELKAIARTPSFGRAEVQRVRRDSAVREWLEAKVRNVIGESEMSAFGTPGETGILTLEIPAASALAKAGLAKDDVIISLDGQPVPALSDLHRRTASFKPGQKITIGVLRAQKLLTIPFVVPTDARLSFAPVIAPAADGAFVLKAGDAEVIGTGGARIDGTNIGNWKNPADVVRWNLQVPRPGTYAVTLEYSLNPGSDGSEFSVSAGGAALAGKLAATGGWGTYRTVALGALEVPKAGRVMLAVEPTKKTGEAVMNLRALTLTPGPSTR